MWPDHVRVVLDEAPRAGLADEVRERIPAAVEVVLAPRETGDGRRATDPDRLRRTPRDLFAEYLVEHDVADDRLVPLFDELVEQVTAEPSRRGRGRGRRRRGVDVRPVRLEVEGFTVFRTPTVVDFAGADLFALVGPTGAGKTSIIDALTFALYGSIPRLDDRRAVAPVISQNLTEARVRLDFTVDGQAHSAVRVVRATKAGGATTKEARLERAGEVLAGTADEVTDAVTALLGLTFDHFTTCVSLPQGQFARFLHDKPRSRQDLLVKLLDLGLYDRVATAARARAAVARGRVDLAAGQLERLSGATPEARAAAADRVAALAALDERLAAERPVLDELNAEVVAAEAAADEATGRLALLDRLVAPPGVAELAADVAAADRARRRGADARRRRRRRRGRGRGARSPCCPSGPCSTGSGATTPAWPS